MHDSSSSGEANPQYLDRVILIILLTILNRSWTENYYSENSNNLRGLSSIWYKADKK